MVNECIRIKSIPKYALYTDTIGYLSIWSDTCIVHGEKNNPYNHEIASKATHSLYWRTSQQSINGRGDLVNAIYAYAPHFCHTCHYYSFTRNSLKTWWSREISNPKSNAARTAWLCTSKIEIAVLHAHFSRRRSTETLVCLQLGVQHNNVFLQVLGWSEFSFPIVLEIQRVQTVINKRTCPHVWKHITFSEAQG